MPPLEAAVDVLAREGQAKLRVENLSRELGVSRAMLPAFFFAGDGGLDRLAEFGERYVQPAREEA